MSGEVAIRGTAAEMVVEALQHLGVELVFGLPGVHNLPLWKALAGSSVRVVGVRHEQAAVYAADGYARAGGRLGVAAVTSGPGAANTVGAVGEAMAKHAMRFREEITAVMTSINNSTSGAEAHLPFGGNGKSGNGPRQSGYWVLDQFTSWQSVNWDCAGKLPKAQMDIADVDADLDFRLD